MSNYWKERFLKEEQRVYDLSEEEIKKQLLEYDKAIASLNKDIEIWYNRIAKNNDVSLAEAKRLLSAKELKEFRWTVDEYIKHGKENGITKDWSKQLENASARVHIERLEALKIQTRGQIEKLYNGRESGFKNFLKNVYTDQHQRTAFEFAKETGVGTNFYKINENLVEDIIKKPWALDGKNFSDRIWSDKEKLINTLHTEMTQGFIRGDSLEDITKRITAKINVSKSNVKRLVRTESAAYRSKAQLKAFQDLEVEKYQVLATLDARTSDICQDMDGKVFDFKDYEIGTTAPPFHVNCRSVTIPYFDDEEEGERAARDPETGKTIYVSDKMTYKEWKQKFLVEKGQDILDGVVGSVVAEPTIVKVLKNEFSRSDNREKDISKNNKVEKIKTLDELSNNWYERLTDEEKQEIFRYSTGDNIDASSYTRGLYKTEYQEEINYYEKLIKNMDNAIDKFELDRDIKVYRSVQGNFYRQFGLDEDDVYILDKFRIGNNESLENYKKLFGKEFIDKGYVSTSLNMNEPFRLNGDDTHTLFEINVKKGTSGAYLGKNSAIASQEEFLLKRNTKFKIKDLELKNISYIDDYGQEIIQRVLVVKVDTVPEKMLKNVEDKGIIKVKENIPKTLGNHQKYLENWYDKKLKNLVSKEDEKIVSKTLKNVIDKSDFAMRYKVDYIENLIESGRFKNTFETNTSGGATSPIIKKFRKQAPINLFGTTEKLKKIDYEKYGYITDKSFLNDYNSKMNDTLKMYGDVIIKFNKENLKNKVTFTVNDSLGNVVREKVIASSVDKPGIHSMEIEKIKSYTDILRKNKINNVLELIDELKVRYLETQYHGELLLSDVTEICFTDRIPNNESLNKLKKLGIKLYRIEGGKIVEI